MTKLMIVDGVEYVPKGSLATAKTKDGMKYVIIRTYSAGVFAGYLNKKTGQSVILNNARRLWYWDGAASLSELAMSGVKKPENCKFPIEVPEIELEQVIEVIPCTNVAQESIANVSIWES